MKPDLSIIIPVFNGQNHIDLCMDSILSQNNVQDFEIIIVNDGSTDRSEKIIHKYSMRYDNVVQIKQPNKGVSWARNTAIERSAGKYLTFVDVDDRVGVSYNSIKDLFNGGYNNSHKGLIISKRNFKNKKEINYTFEKDYFVKMLSAVNKSDAQIGFAGKFTVNHDDTYIKQHVYTQDATYADSDAEKLILLDHSDRRESANFALYSRDFLDKNNIYFQPNMKLDEDMLFCMQAVLSSNKATTISDSTYLYNRHTNSLSNFSEKLAQQHKYTIASIQRYSAFLYFVAKDDCFDSLFNLWIKNFALLREKASLVDRCCFPSILCYQCDRKSCKECYMKEREVHRIKENIKEFLPDFLHLAQMQNSR